MQATFIQKVIICMIAGFFAACLWQWGIVFVTGADEALNGGYKKTPPAQTTAHR
jgi:nucleoside recognition membrane protein YjiH